VPRTGAHVGYEPWVEHDALIARDAGPGWKRWRRSRCGCTVSESGQARRHALAWVAEASLRGLGRVL
jgi:hypothetical protein